MQPESGDDYIRRLASFVRLNEKGLAEALPIRRRPSHQPQPSSFSPFSWFGIESSLQSPTSRPVILSLDIHHLSYVLVRLEALGIDVGSLDVKVDNPSRPVTNLNIFSSPDRSETLSMTSLRSSLSVVSGLSLGAAWWMRPEPPSVDAELKYLYSSFTKLPALTVQAPGRQVVAELMNDPPNETALPLDAFKNLQSLVCVDLDPRILLGWDRLAESLRSLKIQNSGLEDISDIFVGAVLEDEARRQGVSSTRRRYSSNRPSPSHTNIHSASNTSLGGTGSMLVEDKVPTAGGDNPSAQLSSLKWAFLKHLSLPDNSLTFFPIESIPYLTSLTHLDLSSNLLVSVPPGLASLHNLISLNLSDNMIDSVLGIYLNLGQILSLNLARNRLDSICGLERMMALERVDLRHNLVEECDEISRLAVLPNISELWVEGNLFAQYDDNYRVKCFNYFLKEGKEITLDGSSPTFLERRNLIGPPQTDPPLSRPAPLVSQQPAATPPGVSNKQIPGEHPHTPEGQGDRSALAEPALVKSTHKKKKVKRIVEITADNSSPPIAFPGGSSHSENDTGMPVSPVKTREYWGGAETNHLKIATANLPSATGRSRHQRHQTEHRFMSTVPEDSTGSVASSRSAARRSRMSASVYEPNSAGELGSLDEEEFKVVDAAEAYRRRIEALKQDMGDAWLKVLSQSQLKSAR
ncbi:hypothetical protein AX16_005260 [Volvariella volvacea WC 439]|nr:hypothetical protein AX16_005260 [Volvariella volvacea WC 439]